MSTENFVGYIFILFLFASSLTSDIQEAQIEGSLMKFMIRSNPCTHPSIWVLFVSNRMRSFMLPLVTCVTGLSIVLFESMSTKNILLNLLAIIFICDGDNLLASLFFPPSWHGMSEGLADSARGDPKIKYSFLMSRALVLLYFAMMMVLSRHIQDLLDFVAPGEACAGFDEVQQLIILGFGSFVIVLLSVLWTISSKNNESTCIGKLLQGLNEFCMIFQGLLLTDICFTVKKHLTFTNVMSEDTFVGFLPLIVTIGVWTRINQVLKNSRYSLKWVAVDISLGASWVCSVYYFAIKNPIIKW